MLKGRFAVPVEKLRIVCDPGSFQFKSTSEIEPIRGFIGQEKAVEALRFGLEIDSHEYHIFATDSLGTGREAVLRDFLEKFAEEKMAEGKVELHDICCVHNFNQPNRPRILILKKGGGRKLKECLEDLLAKLREKIFSLPAADEFVKPKDEIMSEFAEESERLERSLQDFIEKEGFVLQKTSAGPVLIPKIPGNEYEQLPEAEKRSFDKKQAALTKKIDKFINDVSRLHENSLIKIEELKYALVADIMRPNFKKLSKEYSGSPQLTGYLKELAKYVLSNIDFFLVKNEMKNMEYNGNGCFLPFNINVLVDNGGTEKMPIVFESDPSFANLFGEIKKKFIQGASFADHTCLEAGSMALANGGYLVLNFWDVIKNPAVWEKLKKTLKGQSLKIEEPMSYLGFFTANLNPDPIPIKLKVIVIGSPLFYHLLAEHDPDFLGVFKTKVEFDSEMPLTSENLQSYASFIAYYCRQEDPRRAKGKLLPFTPAAVAKIAEHGIRLAEKQTKLSTQFDRIKDLVVESDFWASKTRGNEVLADHVRKALEAQKSRLNLAEEKIKESIQDEIMMIDTEGEKVGQINGLAVYGSYDYCFGKPSRITARTFVGSKGVVSIQREVKMSGPIHDTGVLVLSGYFGEKYGKDKLVSFSASLCFEQSYGGIEGNSASAAELISLISSLSGLPINQSFAVTGSVNQFGEIQPIGGVNEKIEGFFDVCEKRGLTGSQGVIIPSQNVQNLMLREDVVDAVKSIEFAVYTMKTIDDGIELLMGKSPEEVHKKVDERLREMSKKQKPEK